MSLQELIELKEDMDRQLKRLLAVGDTTEWLKLANAREEVINSITYRAKIMVQLVEKKVA